jgi:uncharacterized membrane protein YcaP (DUF421 family)
MLATPHAFWPDLLALDVPLLEKVVRTVAVYAFLLVGLRLAGKRELAQLNPFDLVVLLLLSNTLQNAIIGDDLSLVGGIFGGSVLLVINYLVVRFLYAHPRLDELVEGEMEVLVEDGEVRDEALARNLVTRAELEEAARRQGIESFGEVLRCQLEVGGAITFTRKAPSDEEVRHREVMLRLDALERQIAALAAGRAAAP